MTDKYQKEDWENPAQRLQHKPASAMTLERRNQMLLRAEIGLRHSIPRRIRRRNGRGRNFETARITANCQGTTIRLAPWSILRTMSWAARSADIKNGLDSGICRLIGVSRKPGDTKVTATPCSAMRMPNASANMARPAFAPA